MSNRRKSSSKRNQSKPNQSKPNQPKPNQPKPNRRKPAPVPAPNSFPDDPLRPNTKRTGERSEAAFLYQATQRRFAICKPWGDSERYDFILDNRPQPDIHLFRIQVKCTDSLRAGAYETRATYTYGNRHIPYTKRDIDFIAAHIVELNLWYIVPVEVCTPAPMLRFYPHRKAKKMRLEKFREAWAQLDPPFPNPSITIHACADPDYPEPIAPDFDSNDFSLDDLQTGGSENNTFASEDFKTNAAPTPDPEPGPELPPLPVPNVKPEK